MKWGGVLLLVLLLTSSFPPVLAVEGNESPESYCGDGTCDSGEDYTSCPSDCEAPSGPVCGDGTCDSGEDSSSCPGDCGEPEPVLISLDGDIATYKASLSLSGTSKNVANDVMNKVSDCISKVNANDYYEMSLVCRQNDYRIREKLKEVIGLSDSDWDKLIDYIMLNTQGDPNHWVDGDGVVYVNDDKELIKEKLHFGLGRYETNEGGMDAWSNLNIMWGSYSLSDADEDRVKQAEKDYWSWEDDLRKEALKSKISAGDKTDLGGQFLDSINSIYDKIKSHDAKPTSDTAYELAYAQRLREGEMWGMVQSEDPSTVSGACKYASLNSPGQANIWEDEFGNIRVHGARIYESSSRKGLRAEFNCWEGDDGSVGANIWLQWDKNSLSDYRDAIKRGRKDAESEARKLEVAGKLAEFLETFTITPENKELAEEVVKLVDELADRAADVKLTKDDLYSFEYDAVVKGAEVEGITQGLTCAEMDEVGPYVMIYSKGTPEVHEDEFGELMVSNWKQIFKNDFLRLNLGTWCDEFNDRGSVNINAEWSAKSTREFSAHIKKARDNAWKEADRLRRKGMVIKARKLYNFTLEQEEVGNSIIDLLEAFADKIISFESGPTADGAYQLMYDSILLSAEVEGYAQAYGVDAELIGVYVLLYGPGVADVWMDEFGDLTAGHNLNVYRGDDLEFNFNRWFDDYSGKGGFNSWLNFGKLRKEYRDEIKLAEREAWIEADMLRRKGLARKKRGELEDAGVDAEAYVNALKDYLTLFSKYLNGDATAFDLELKRLQVSDLMHELDEDTRDYMMVSDLGDDVPPTDIWLEWDTDEIMVGGWRELVRFNESLKQPFTGMSGWCEWERDVCNIDVHIDWVEWKAVRKDIDRANELFWRQNIEGELAEDLASIVATKSDYSSGDQAIESNLVKLLGGLKAVGEGYTDDVESLQYSVLVEQDSINDELDEADNQGIIRVAIADTEGFHEYDDWIGEVRGVVVYSGDDIEIIVRFHEVFTPFFLEGEELEAGEFDVMIDIIWKDWNPELEEQIAKAFDRYEREQSVKRLEKLVSRRDDFVPADLADKIKAKVDVYENGDISMSELKRFVNNYYYRIMGYDTQVAYLAALSNNTYPVFDRVNIIINTEHVNLQLYERDFSYRFGGAARIDNDFFAPASELVKRDIEFRDPELIKRGEDVTTGVIGGPRDGTAITDVTGRSVTAVGSDDFDNRDFDDDKFDDRDDDRRDDRDLEGGKGEMFEKLGSESFMSPEDWEEDDLDEFEHKKRELMDKKREVIDNIHEKRIDMFKGRKIVRPKGFKDRLFLNGIKPRLKFSVDLTPEEVKRIANEIKAKWSELNDSGIIYDIVYNINNDIDKFPALGDAVREWGDVTTSIRLRYENESVFEISFQTQDGYIVWVDYGIIEGAGTEPNTVFIELDFEALMRLKNAWEQTAKNAENIFEVIGSIPAMFGNVVGMLVSGEITIQPFGVVFRIPNMLKVMFEAMMEGSGISI